MWEFNHTDELYHHGILGMKWGVRRYQNKDGSLTPAGKKRADKMKEEYTALTGKRLIRKPTPKKTEVEVQAKPKKIKEMSDQEIKDMINRLDNEKRLAGLQADTASAGQKIARTIAKDMVAPAALEAGRTLIKDALIKIGKDKLGLGPKESEAVDEVYKELKKEVNTLELERNKYKFQEEINRYKKKADEANASKESNNSRESIDDVHNRVAESIKKLDQNDKKTKKEEIPKSTNYQDERWRRTLQSRSK